jgi:hypothetical protein
VLWQITSIIFQVLLLGLLPRGELSPVCAGLSCVAVQVRSLILEVEDEPELDAGVGEGEADLIAYRESDCLFYERVLVAVKDAPDLVVSAPAFLCCFACLGALCFHGSLDKLQWAAPERIYRDIDPIAVSPVPVSEVLLFCAFSLDEREQLKSECGPGNASSRRPYPFAPVHGWSPEVVRSAAASNSWRERIGVAPYRPAR